ncbi:MAG: B12-binding domain-containing radical SAM protein, partial [Deltaproteobacteria bacterium]|nr:B12-binding domain-containing radical SAM protein [Deltaproteobacteria bacterium]
LCVYPYRKDLKKFRFIPPIGLELIGKVIEPYAQALDIIDLRYESKRTLDFLRPETDMVCFSVNWKRRVERLRKEIMSVPPDIFTILGGRHATEDPEGWLTSCPNVDAVVRGDGEEVMEDLCRGVPLENIAGLSFRNGDGIIHNSVRRLGPLKDQLYPNRSLRRYTYEVEIGNISTGVELDMFSASRGCPFNCTFCSFNFNPWGEKRNWSGRSPESIVDELAQIKAPLIGFTDEIFTHNMDRVERICDLILDRGIRKKYIINARLEIARRPDVIRKMELAGFSMFLLGIESAQDKTLRSMRKGFNTAKIREYFDVLRGRPILLHGYFILGNIGENVAEMKQIIPFARELGLDSIVLCILRNNPHSGIEELVAQNSDYHIAPSGRVYSDHCSEKELRRLRRSLHRKFYSRRQLLRILDKGRRSGLVKLPFSQGISNSARFVNSLLKALVAGHQR